MPGHDKTGFVLRTFAKSPADDPLWRSLVEVWTHRTKYSGYTRTLQRRDMVYQPVWLRPLVVVNKSDGVAGGFRQCCVTGERDTAPRLGHVIDRDGKRRRHFL